MEELGLSTIFEEDAIGGGETELASSTLNDGFGGNEDGTGAISRMSNASFGEIET